MTRVAVGIYIHQILDLEPTVARCYVLQSASFWELIPNNGEVTKIRHLEYAVESLACSCIVVLQAKTGLIRT